MTSLTIGARARQPDRSWPSNRRRRGDVCEHPPERKPPLSPRCPRRLRDCLSGGGGRARGPPTAIAQHRGRGVNTITMERPFHIPGSEMDLGQAGAGVDMGLDRIIVIDFDEQSGRLAPSPHPYAQAQLGRRPAPHCRSPEPNRSVYTVNGTGLDGGTRVCVRCRVLRDARDRDRIDAAGRSDGFNRRRSWCIEPDILYSLNRGHNSTRDVHHDPDSGPAG